MIAALLLQISVSIHVLMMSGGALLGVAGIFYLVTSVSRVVFRKTPERNEDHNLNR